MAGMFIRSDIVKTQLGEWLQEMAINASLKPVLGQVTSQLAQKCETVLQHSSYKGLARPGQICANHVDVMGILEDAKRLDAELVRHVIAAKERQHPTR